MKNYLAYAWMQFVLYFKQGKFELDTAPVDRKTHWQDMDGNWYNKDGKVNDTNLNRWAL